MSALANEMKPKQHQRRRASGFFAEGLVDGGLKTQKQMAIRGLGKSPQPWHSVTAENKPLNVREVDCGSDESIVPQITTAADWYLGKDL